MDIQRKCFEESNNVNPDWSFKFNEELQQYIALDSEMELQVDEFNELWDAFRAGWLAAQAQAVQGWISVQDRMPEQGQKVLVFRPDAHNHPHKDPNFKICTYAGADIFINSHFEHVITHWKPLESPIEAQEPTNESE